jgi:hypothetical protein
MNDELIIPATDAEIIDIYLSPENYPVAYERKVRCLMNSGLTREEVEAIVLTTPIQMEIFYDIDRGLFAVESEPIAYIDIFNPYTGEVVEKEEED